MQTTHATKMIAAIAVIALSVGSTAPAAITTFAEYHLGEAGSLGTDNLPLDSSGNSRDFTNAISGGTTSVGTLGVYAPGSTAYLDTSGAGNEGWYGADMSTLPTDNIAFGVFARASALPAENADVFTLGGGVGAYKLTLGANGWASSADNAAWIGPAEGVPGSFNADTWVHLAIIRTGGLATFYIDGVSQGTFVPAPVNGAGHIAVNPGGARYFHGLIDEARVLTFTNGESTANVLKALQAIPTPAALPAGLIGAAMVLTRRRRH